MLEFYYTVVWFKGRYIVADDNDTANVLDDNHGSGYSSVLEAVKSYESKQRYSIYPYKRSKMIEDFLK